MATSGNRKQTPIKKQTSAKKRTTTKSQQEKKKKEDEFIKSEIIILIMFAVSALLLISNFGVGGAVGGFFSKVMFGLFGLFAYILPVALFLMTAFIISNRQNKIATRKLIGIVIASLCLCGIAQLLTRESKEVESIASYYTYGAEHKLGGGFIGGVFSRFLENAFDTIGTWIILLVLVSICFVIISEKSVVKQVKKGGDKVYKTAKEDAERRRVREIQRKQDRMLEDKTKDETVKEEKTLRREKKITGVSLGATTIKEVNTDEMRELVVEDEPDLREIEGLFDMPMEVVDEEETLEIVPEEETFLEMHSKEEINPVEELERETSESFRRELEDKLSETEEKKPIKSVMPVTTIMPVTTTQAVSGHTYTKSKTYTYPPLHLLKQVKNTNQNNDRMLKENGIHLQQILRDFGVNVTVTDVSCGPSVTRYELQPDQGVKVSRIVSLADDIKLNMAVADIRIEAPIPGKAAVGIEVPNAENTMVSFRELIESKEFKEHPSKIAFSVGKDIAGKIMVTDIAKMPHVLIAGATGSGKSVCINTLIMSILYKANPDEVKLIMVDPKVVELSVYNGIPHLLIPVVTDPKKAAGALNWAVAEMTNRYKLFADYNVRNLEGYNQKIKNIEHIDDDTKPKKLPQIVIIVDELADLMMVAPGEVEDAICRLAQLARAAGIHLVIATQRPSVNVITGLIKANMPSRIAFAVSSGVDSRTIIDMNGAEKLLGKGDMLFYPYGYTKPVRVQGAFVTDEEVGDVVEFLAKQNQAANYDMSIQEQISNAQTQAMDAGNGDAGDNGKDALFVEAGRFIIEKDKASIGMLQRWFKVGFNRAARIMDQLADAGIVGSEAGTKPREILMSMEEFENYIEECL